MTQWVSFDEIKGRVSIEDILNHYGVKLRQRRDELTGLCPFPEHDDTRASFSANTIKTIFQCFSCKKSGNVLDLVAYMEGVEIREAGLLLQEWFQIDVTKPSETITHRPQRREQPRESVIPPEGLEKLPLSFTLQLDETHLYLAQRGLKPETIAEFGLGFSSRGVMKDRIAIPIHDEYGQLVAYSGRWPGEPPQGEPKYKLPEGFHKFQVLYNLHRVGELAREEGLILTEGFFTVFHLWQAGIANVASLMGSSISEHQVELITENLGPDGRVQLLMDEDDAGDECRGDCLEKLSPDVWVKSIRLPEDFRQPDEMDARSIAKLIIT